MYVTLNFDVEDLVYPPDERTDEIPGWIARTLTEMGLRGTFHVIGDKARAMLQRKRQETLALMTEHEIGTHSDSFRHPVVPEIVEGCGWADGVEKLVAYEKRAIQGIHESFWKPPVSMSSHAFFTAPQAYGAAAEIGLPYMYGFAYCPGHSGPVWYAGALSFPTRGDEKLPSAFLSLGLDPVLSHDDEFHRKLDLLRGELDRRVAAGIEYLTLFVCHPVRIRSTGWTEDELYANGLNCTTEEFGYAYELKTLVWMEKAKANFRRFCEYLRGRKDIEVIGLSRATELFRVQPPHISRDVLLAYCQAGENPTHPRLDPAFSPGELLTGLAESLVEGESRGGLPRAVERRTVLGPIEKPILVPQIPFATREELLGLCRELADAVKQSRHLPANLRLGEARIGLGSLHAACVTAFAAACRGDQIARLRLQCVPRYPAFAGELDRTMSWHEESRFLAPEFSAERLRLHARLQTWSLKPARMRYGSGPYLEAGGFVPSNLISQR